MQNIQPKQISKVVYEAIRAYGVTIGEAEKKSWEATIQADRDDVLNKVDALLAGTPQAPASIRPSDQVKAKLLSSIVGAFVQVYNPPVQQVTTFVQPESPVQPIPVEVFANPDEPATVAEAMKVADAHIAASNAPVVPPAPHPPAPQPILPPPPPHAPAPPAPAAEVKK